MNFKLLSATISLLFCLNGISQTWQATSNFSGNARLSCEMTELNGKGYLLFGDRRDTINYYNDIWEYNPVTDNWIPMPLQQIAARTLATALGNDSNLIIGLGWNGSSTFKDLYTYDPTNNVWDTLPIYPGNGGRSNLTAIANGKLYVGGGNTGTSAPYDKDFWEYDIQGRTWTNIGNLPFGNRIGGIGKTIDSVIYMGFGHNGSNDFNDLWAYNTVTNTWLQKANFPGTGRLGMNSFVLDGKLVVGGGHRLGSNGQSLKSDYYQYDPLTNTWSLFSNGFTNPGRTFSGSFVINNVAYLYGGTSNYPFASNDMWKIQGNTVGIIGQHNEASLKLSVYPNPTRSEITIMSNEGIIDGTLTIFNSLGQIIIEQEFNKIDEPVSVDLRELDNATYFYRFSTPDSKVSTGTILKFD